MMGKLTVVGIGPGNYDNMTVRADRVLRECQVIVGYHVYVDLVRERYPDKEFLTTPMTKEADRCRMALDAARTGKDVAMVCSGDSGIYGMAALIYQLRGEDAEPEVEVVPGLTAACSGAALLGAPLTHDFAVISLSDLLTPWEKIERRLQAAAQADFVICLYNPSSRKRKGYLKKACDLLLKHMEEARCCGYVENIGREGTEIVTCSLRELRDQEVNMFTTVFIGNSSTKKIGEYMVTPRGYRHG